MKKPFSMFFRRFKQFLKLLIDCWSIVFWSRLFHRSTTRSEKNFHISSLHLCLANFRLCPRVWVLPLISHIAKGHCRDSIIHLVHFQYIRSFSFPQVTTNRVFAALFRSPDFLLLGSFLSVCVGLFLVRLYLSGNGVTTQVYSKCGLTRVLYKANTMSLLFVPNGFSYHSQCSAGFFVCS